MKILKSAIVLERRHKKIICLTMKFILAYAVNRLLCRRFSMWYQPLEKINHCKTSNTTLKSSTAINIQSKSIFQLTWPWFKFHTSRSISNYFPKRSSCNLIVLSHVSSRRPFCFHLASSISTCMLCATDKKNLSSRNARCFRKHVTIFPSILSHWIFNISGATKTAIKNHLRDCIVFPLLKYFP